MGRSTTAETALRSSLNIPGREFQSRGHLPIIVEVDQRVDTGVLMVSSVAE